MLTGKGKTDYQRDYMRRKRAGKPTRTTPKPKAKPAPKPKNYLPALDCAICGDVQWQLERPFIAIHNERYLCPDCINKVAAVLAEKRAQLDPNCAAPRPTRSNT